MRVQGTTAFRHVALRHRAISAQPRRATSLFDSRPCSPPASHPTPSPFIPATNGTPLEGLRCLPACRSLHRCSWNCKEKTMSRGFDGFEIDDFRSPDLDADRGSDRTPTRDWKSIESLNRIHREEDRADRLDREQRDRHNADRPPLPREERDQGIPSERVRTKYVDRNKTYSLRDSEIHTLMELGTFRVIAETDLAELGYAKDRSRMEHDIENLQKQGLVQQRAIEETDYPTTRVLALTKQGHRLLSRGNLLPRDQSTYHGFAKPKEARHDADLYRLYCKVAGEIESKGGRVVHVKLDYELKRRLYHDLERTAGDKDMETAKKEVAERHHLKVVHV